MKSRILVCISLAMFSFAFTACSKKAEVVIPSEPTWLAKATDCLGACGGQTSIKDIDGNEYSLVEIGNQCWTKQNLKTSTYSDGSSIVTGLNDADWNASTSGAYAVYDNLPANNTTYGKLYNWYAVNDSRGLAPSGWHVPTLDDWNTLCASLGSNATLVAGLMKTTGTTDWLTPNAGATNSSGFSALPGGLRLETGEYISQHELTYWWSSSIYQSNGNPWHLGVSYVSNIVFLYDVHKADGYSVRLIKDK